MPKNTHKSNKLSIMDQVKKKRRGIKGKMVGSSNRIKVIILKYQD